MRVYVLYFLIIFLAVYAWKDWFKSLCGLFLLMAVLEHDDMPSSMFGIQGLNPWNFLFAVVFLVWMIRRRHEGLQWDMPRHLNILLVLYLGVILLGVLRMVLNRSYLQWYPIRDMISEELINTIKWVLPGILLFDGCRTRKQLILAISCLLAMYFLIALQVILNMPLEAVTSDSNVIMFSRRKLDYRVGYNACDLSAMLAGVSWGLLATLTFIRKKRYWPVVLASAGVIILGQALTGGRAGYLAWGATGLTLCLLKWRKWLILAPLLIIVLPIVFPGATTRMLSGFGEIEVSGETTYDDIEVTGGRSVMWPIVIDKIGESLMFGYGRYAMIRTGLSRRVWQDLGDTFPHPHNVYLETLLDNGIIGSLPICLFWGIVIVYSIRLFRSTNRLFSAIGGFTLALTVAQLVAGIGAQHYFPKEGTFGLWTAALLAIRVHVEKERAQILTTVDQHYNISDFPQSAGCGALYAEVGTAKAGV